MSSPNNGSSSQELAALAATSSEQQSASQQQSVNDSAYPIEVDDEEVNEEEEEDEDGNVGSKRKLTSPVWNEFKRVKVCGRVKAKCNHCAKQLGGDTKNGTKHLHDHLKICPYRKSKIMAAQQKTYSQSSLRFSSQDCGKVSVGSYTFDQDVARKELAAMLVLHEYPLSMVDHAGFRRFVSSLQPLFKMVTRNTIRTDIVKQFEEERKKAIRYMAGIKSRIAITTDMWTSDNQKKGYMAVTAHFIDESWKLRSIVMRFIYVPAPHTSQVIADQLNESLVEWNLDEKVSTITVDNCTTNDKAIDLLVKKIGPSKFMLNGTMVHMRCCAHILNLIVKDGSDIIKKAIEKIRDSVAYWIATPKRIEKFEEIAKYVKVTVDKKLCLDCKTRWNSTYVMLNVAIPYKAVFDRAIRVDKQFDCAPSEDQWEFAAMVVERLGLFYKITEMFSGKDYVTANIYFPKLCEIKMKMRQWSTCGNPTIQAMSVAMNEKFDKYWTDIQGLMGIATLLDPRFKTEMLLVCYEMLMGVTGEECEKRVRDVSTNLCNLMNEYHVETEEDNTESSSKAPSIQAPEVMSIFNARVAKKRPSSLRLKSKLDRYLEDDYVISKERFSVLDWWKVAGTRYPTLRMIARDVFAIPVSIVASESAFSTSGRVLSEHRSRLTPQMLEALMCSQDWLRNKFKAEEKAEIASFWTCLQDIQEGMQDLAL